MRIMEILFYLGLFLYLFVVGSLMGHVDYDFFARLIVGKTYFQTGEILKYDFLSYTPTHPWYDHEWGASVLFYFLHNNFGDIGLFIFKAISLFITFFILIQIIKLRRKALEPDKKFPIFNFLFFFVMLQPVFNLIFSLRCHHFTFMFFALWLYCLEKARLEKNYGILWVLPLLMIVWSNIHGGCFMAFGITGLYIIGEFLRKKPVLPYIYTFIASFLLMFINPYGVDYVTFLIKATTMHRTSIVEWQPLFGQYYLFKFIKFKLILICIIALSLYKFIKAYTKTTGENFVKRTFEVWNNIDKTKFLLVLVMFVLCFKSVRFITYFIFVLIPFCYDDFYSTFEKFRLKDSYNRIKELIIYAIIFVTFVLNISVRKINYSNFHNIFPLTEIEFLIENKVKGNLLVPFECGSYAAYKLFPDNYIYIDGRYEEVYNPDLNDVHLKKILLCEEGWKKELNKYHNDIMIIYKEYPIYDALKINQERGASDYYLLMESRKFALFMKKDVYEKIKKPVIIPTDERDFYDKTIWNTNINWMKK